MNDIEWLNRTIALEGELKKAVAGLGFQHVKVMREFVVMKNRTDYNVYFCDDEGRRRITVSLETDEDDLDLLVRRFVNDLGGSQR